MACSFPTIRYRPLVALAGRPMTAREIMGLRLKADLVTLSACQTGITTPGAGDDPMGLPRAILQAGAGAALVTQWSVESRSAWAPDERLLCHNARAGRRRQSAQQGHGAPTSHTDCAYVRGEWRATIRSPLLLGAFRARGRPTLNEEI